jgi:release factor glutamine methyltransferase
MQKEIHPGKDRGAVILPKTKLFNRVNWLLQEKYDGVLTKEAKQDIQRLKAGEPLDYIIGHMEFLGCKIDLSKKPLIPRVETEYWVEEAIHQISNTQFPTSGLKILDIFSGSGCIGISIMRQIKNAHVVFADSQDNCIKQIAINCKVNKIDKKRYAIAKSDIFSALTGTYDYVFANPPYIPAARKHKVQASVLKYEPKPALFGGDDGLWYIRKFLAQAKNFLNPNGKIYMEFDSIQKREIEKLLKKYSYSGWQFYKDQYGKWRWVEVQNIHVDN